MTREDAIDHVLCLSASVAGQLCVGEAEMDALESETRDALRALGVLDSELA